MHRPALLFPAALVASLMVAACTHTRPVDRSSPHPCPSPEGCVTFRVQGAAPADQPHDTPVLLVSGSGVSPFGSTDSEGILVVPKSLLAAPDVSVLLFCWDNRSEACTAVRLDSGTIPSYDWVNVSLPANRLTRRSQAHQAPSPTPRPSP